MKWVSTGSNAASVADAVADSVRKMEDQLEGERPDLILLFLSEHYQLEYDVAAKLVVEKLGPRHLIGCSSGGVIGGGAEIEQEAGLSLTAAVLPNVDLSSFHLEANDLPDEEAKAQDWEKVFGVTDSAEPHFVLLPDPYSFDCEGLLAGLDLAFPNAKKVGGLASGASQPGENALFLDDRVYSEGAVGIALAGDVSVDTLVAQGCRPVGLPMFITKCYNNILQELDCRLPRDVLEELFVTLSARDQQLFQSSLFLGIVMRPGDKEYSHGDFLVRNIVGVDPEAGYLAIGSLLQEKSIVQFHLRDAATSKEDLEVHLREYSEAMGDVRLDGALLFSCLGRGKSLYGKTDHDTDLFRHHLGQVPLGGFFCNGEIGPVQGRTYLHGYTSSFVLFRQKSRN